MSSLTNTQVNARSMNGLVNVEANSGTFDEIDCNTLNVALSATAPTRAFGDNTTNIATTAFVANATTGSFMTLNTTQTITGDKTYTGQADFLSLTATYISNTSSIDTPSITSGLGSDSLNVGANQTSGILFLGCRSNRTGAINIGTLATGNAPIVIGSNVSTTQTASHNAITTFNKVPFCSIAPATGNHLTNKTYVDDAISTATTGFVDVANTQTISGQKTFSNANTYISGNTITNNLKSTSGSLNISTNSASVVDNINITTGADLILNCGSSGIGKIYLTKDGGTCMSINDAGATFNVDVDFFGQTTIDPFTIFNMMPTATIIQNASSVVPSGFLYCDGTAVSRTTYSTLFNRIGTTYGVGNGTTTYNLPNYKGAFLRGASSQVVGGITYTAGAVGTAQQDMALTTPVSGYSTPLSSTGFRSCGAGTRDAIARTSQGDPIENPTGLNLAYPTGRGGAEVRPMNHAVYYYIRY